MAIEILEENQQIREREVNENLDFDPPKIKTFYITNKIIRAFAHLFARSVDGIRYLACTTAGILKVAVQGSGYENNDTKSGTAGDAYAGADIAFDQVASTVDIYIETHDAIIKRSKDGVSFDDEFWVPAGAVVSIDAVTHSFNIKNRVGGSNAVYQVIGWY